MIKTHCLHIRKLNGPHPLHTVFPAYSSASIPGGLKSPGTVRYDLYMQTSCLLSTPGQTQQRRAMHFVLSSPPPPILHLRDHSPTHIPRPETITGTPGETLLPAILSLLCPFKKSISRKPPFPAHSSASIPERLQIPETDG